MNIAQSAMKSAVNALSFITSVTDTQHVKCSILLLVVVIIIITIINKSQECCY